MTHDDRSARFFKLVNVCVFGDSRELSTARSHADQSEATGFIVSVRARDLWCSPDLFCGAGASGVRRKMAHDASCAVLGFESLGLVPAED
jgi:hypothetical protein